MTLVEPTDPLFLLAVCSICLPPLYWNCLGRAEYKTQFLSKWIGQYTGCYLFAVTIFALGLIREYCFHEVLQHQQTVTNSLFATLLSLDKTLQPSVIDALKMAELVLCVISLLAGSVFVLAAYYQLGITGTYLGDYFGILMKEKVTSFPFNVISNPMYTGSTMIFLAHSIWAKSAAGLSLTVILFITYRIAILFEEPFTCYIYDEHNKAQKQKKK